jgi:hypothetical protein
MWSHSPPPPGGPPLHPPSAACKHPCWPGYSPRRWVVVGHHRHEPGVPLVLGCVLRPVALDLIISKKRCIMYGLGVLFAGLEGVVVTPLVSSKPAKAAPCNARPVSHWSPPPPKQHPKSRPRKLTLRPTMASARLTPSKIASSGLAEPATWRLGWILWSAKEACGSMAEMGPGGGWLDSEGEGGEIKNRASWVWCVTAPFPCQSPYNFDDKKTTTHFTSPFKHETEINPASRQRRALSFLASPPLPPPPGYARLSPPAPAARGWGMPAGWWAASEA